jgi:hypothetical protein
MKQTKKAQVLAPLLLSLMVPVVAQITGCKKEEPPPPLPAAPSVPTTPPPTAPVELVPETPIAPSASASASAAPTGGGVSAAASLKKCCSALTQNAANAPEPNKTYMLQAAAVCNAAAGAGQASGAAFGAISAALRGAGMPTACK